MDLFEEPNIVTYLILSVAMLLLFGYLYTAKELSELKDQRSLKEKQKDTQLINIES